MKYFNLFSNIQITKGISRIVISDLQRNVSELYPLELYDLIEELKITSIENLLNNYDQESKEIVQEYINLLLEKEYGFVTLNDWDKNFPPLSYDYHDYSTISNLYIEMDDVSILQRIKISVENLGIKHLVIHSKRSFTLEEFLEIDTAFANGLLEGIEVYSVFHDSIDETFLQNLDKKTARIYNLVFYNCKRNPFKIKNTFRFALKFIKQDLQISSCGKVNVDYFNTNLPKVLEAINHNSCLHKKIGIDIDGNIKNCPAMPQIFGNIKKTSLEEALGHSDFKKYWNLTKDHIEVCKDCEFRYICTDCRAYTERTHTSSGSLDISKPLKCGYNPYTGEWEEWSTNPLKEKAIKYYGMEELVKRN
ncbi:grasp-with-spasm system SPASM domain peptide maturase [Elizabethkingia sp. JS20170427COW]|uniref:grasp-with-spasm system SPASM domain peptide maturase n=1 Tax=Elizabethkingia sp. JS20170427COW TaxID=2583851 RepID=UPI0011100597|nr:grasp-with-spasm system SPASM domain peptide maturase [Elizabethkingia sp. JS20170427COW]QCX52552.1 grasp-with-spasm system SPASM domain peptide maturase [Elizabethkingia sp. JS20170427COW]